MGLGIFLLTQIFPKCKQILSIYKFFKISLTDLFDNDY
ncbi:MAG TPA: hemin uptake protein HemP, partial [Acinetobacter nosocomialis]|nr:hemin uptake protein HemP [Acinetobacter nosocomialis]